MPAGFSVADRFVLVGFDLAGAELDGAAAAAQVADDDARALGSAEAARSEAMFDVSSQDNDWSAAVLPLGCKCAMGQDGSLTLLLLH